MSFVADPATGAWIADPYNLAGDNPFEVVGGTSLSAPSWAGLIALANQGRAAAGESTLGSASDPTATQEALYSLPASDFNSVTTGTNGYNAAAGYNLVTGLGTPQANLLIPDLIAYSGPIDFAANAANATVTAATLAEYTGGYFSGGPANAFVEFDAQLAHSAAADGGAVAAASDGSSGPTAIDVSATPAVAPADAVSVSSAPGVPASVQAGNPTPGLASALFASGVVTASPVNNGAIADPQGVLAPKR